MPPFMIFVIGVGYQKLFLTSIGAAIPKWAVVTKLYDRTYPQFYVFMRLQFFYLMLFYFLAQAAQSYFNKLLFIFVLYSLFYQNYLLIFLYLTICFSQNLSKIAYGLSELPSNTDDPLCDGTFDNVKGVTTFCAYSAFQLISNDY